MLLMTKYVRHAVLGFVLFPESTELFHCHVGSWLRERIPGELLSAGFVDFTVGGIRCHGRSDSLDLCSRADDSGALAQQLGTHALPRIGARQTAPAGGGHGEFQ